MVDGGVTLKRGALLLSRHDVSPPMRIPELALVEPRQVRPPAVSEDHFPSTWNRTGLSVAAMG